MARRPDVALLILGHAGADPGDTGPALIGLGHQKKGCTRRRWRAMVLAGRVIDRQAEGGTDTPHYQIHVRGAEVEFRVAVNVLYKQPPSELLYLADEAFAHPVVQGLPGLADGFTLLPSQPGGPTLDYIRANLFDRTMRRPVPATAPGPDNDLADKLDHFVERAAADPVVRLYAFGQRWGPEAATRDKVFGFLPGNGVLTST